MRILRCFSNEVKDTEQDVDKYGGINYVIMQRKNTIFRACSKKKTLQDMFLFKRLDSEFVLDNSKTFEFCKECVV